MRAPVLAQPHPEPVTQAVLAKKKLQTLAEAGN